MLAQKVFQGSYTKTMELLGGTDESKDFFFKKKTEKKEFVAKAAIKKDTVWPTTWDPESLSSF